MCTFEGCTQTLKLICVCACASTPQGPLLFPASFHKRTDSERAADVEALTFMVAKARARVKRHAESPPSLPAPHFYPTLTHTPLKAAAAPCPPACVHTHTHTQRQSAPRQVNTGEDTGESYLICKPPHDPAASAAASYPPRAVKIFKVCGIWGLRARGGGREAAQKSQAKAPKQMCHSQTSLGEDLFLVHSSLLFWKFIHIHYFT